MFDRARTLSYRGCDLENRFADVSNRVAAFRTSNPTLHSLGFAAYPSLGSIVDFVRPQVAEVDQQTQVKRRRASRCSACTGKLTDSCLLETEPRGT
jgi:hypothetical protein